MASEEANETLRLESGPSETDPYAKEWSEQRTNMLRAFLFIHGDEGVDWNTEQLKGMTHRQLVLECSKWQGKYNVDRPWATQVLDLWGDEPGKQACAVWSW